MVYLNLPLPESVTKICVFGVELQPISIAYLVVCTAISTLSAERAAVFNQVATSGLLFSLAAIVGVSSCYFDVANFDPFVNEE